MSGGKSAAVAALFEAAESPRSRCATCTRERLERHLVHYPVMRGPYSHLLDAQGMIVWDPRPFCGLVCWKARPGQGYQAPTDEPAPPTRPPPACDGCGRPAHESLFACAPVSPPGLELYPRILG